MRKVLLTILSLTFYLYAFAQVTPLPNAHAHNDYYHDRPLMEALENGFTSIEIDVFQIEEELYVTHDRPEVLKEELKIESLYFQPLADYIKNNDGEIYKGYDGPFYLMIDFKTDGNATYSVLKKKLKPIKKYLTRYIGDKKKTNLITIFISGNRPKETVLNETKKMVAIDGRPEDLGKGFSANYMPVISDNFRKLFKWRGKGEMPAEEYVKLEALVKDAHAEGKRVRFWASPEREIVWKTLRKAGADLINTDKLERLSVFLKNQ